MNNSILKFQASKIFSIKILSSTIAVITFFVFTGCSSTPTHPLDQVKEDSWLSFEGSNTHPVISDDDQLLAFESRNREEHASSQIYVYSFVTKSERRINFNRADNYLGEIITSSGNKKALVFASSFDEILESQTRSREQLDRIPSLDIYSTQIDGSGLKRLMNSPGYDGAPTLNSNGDWLVFVSRREKNEDLFAFNLKTKKTTKISSTPEMASSPEFSKKKNTLAFFTKMKSPATSGEVYRLYTVEPPFKQKLLVFESTEPLWRLQWIDDSKLMIVKSKTPNDATTLEIWDMTTKQKVSEAKTKIMSRDVAVTHNLKIAIFSEKHATENLEDSAQKGSIPYQIGLTPIQFSQTPPSH